MTRSEKKPWEAKHRFSRRSRRSGDEPIELFRYFSLLSIRILVQVYSLCQFGRFSRVRRGRQSMHTHSILICMCNERGLECFPEWQCLKLRNEQTINDRVFSTTPSWRAGLNLYKASKIGKSIFDFLGTFPQITSHIKVAKRNKEYVNLKNLQKWRLRIMNSCLFF